MAEGEGGEKEDAKKWVKEAGQLPTATGGFGAKMLLAGYSADQAHVVGAHHSTTEEDETSCTGGINLPHGVGSAAQLEVVSLLAAMCHYHAG
jgi:hypothetical protein